MQLDIRNNREKIYQLRIWTLIVAIHCIVLWLMLMFSSFLVVVRAQEGLENAKSLLNLYAQSCILVQVRLKRDQTVICMSTCRGSGHLIVAFPILFAHRSSHQILVLVR